MWLVNEVVMLLVDCQLSLVVIGRENCKQWLVRFDPSFANRPVCCLSVVDVANKSFARCKKL